MAAVARTMVVDDWEWAIWLAITLTAFAVMEFARFHQPTGTLSRTLRRWMGIQPRRWYGRITSALLIGLAALFVWHIVWG